MKFDKFGIFPKTESIKPNSKRSFDISSLINLIPNFLSKQDIKDKPEQTSTQNVNPYSPKNADAYAEYIAKHDAFIKSIKRDE